MLNLEKALVAMAAAELPDLLPTGSPVVQELVDEGWLENGIWGVELSDVARVKIRARVQLALDEAARA